LVTSRADGLCPVLPPLSDILVLRLTRSSCGVYKTVVGMRNVLSQSDPSPHSRQRVTFSYLSRPAGVAATECRTNSDVTIV